MPEDASDALDASDTARVRSGAVSPPFESVTTHEELIEWSIAYCDRAVGTFGFEVDLGRVEWEVSTRAKRRAAAVKRPRFDDAAMGEPRSWDGAVPRCTVSLTWDAFEAFSESEWAATLRHELVHVEQFQRFGTSNHGSRFERRAARADAPLRVRRFAPARYHLSCADCGEVVARRYRECKLVRRYEAYVSSCCSASLTLDDRE